MRAWICVCSLLVLFPSAVEAQSFSVPKGLKKKAGAALNAAQQSAQRAEKALQKLSKDLEAESARVPVVQVERGRKSKDKLLSPKRARLSLSVTAGDAVRASERAKRYLEREQKASPELVQMLATLRARLAKQKRSFTVGVTSVTGKPIANITGIREKRDRKAALAHNREVAESNEAHNLVQATMLARAMPPPHDDAEPQDEDKPVAAASNGIVQPDQVSGTHGAAYPSSRFPSTSTPAFSFRDKASPAQSQEDCGACWAFANAAAFQVEQRLWNEASMDVSEQQLVNCVPPTVSSGNNCEGQWPEVAWQYLMTHGAAQESKVPYRGVMQKCDLTKEEAYKVKVWGFVGQKDPEMPTDEEIKLALVQHGPVVATVRVTDAMQSYTGGVFDERELGPINHAVTIMGWDDVKGAWHVLNSWGTEWGEDGYIWLKYGTNRIGAYGTWAEPSLVDRTGVKSIGTRYLTLSNDNDVPVQASVRAEIYVNSKWVWFPADQGGKPVALSVEVPARGSVRVVDPVTKKRIAMRKAMIWGATRDGMNNWTANKTSAVVTAAGSYKAAARQTFAYNFGKSNEPPVTADSLWTDAHALRKAAKYPESQKKLQAFIERYPDEPRVHAARYYLGWIAYKQKKYWDATEAMYTMASSAPDTERTLGYAFYYTGLSYTHLGYCGYASRNFEVVSVGELGMAKKWTDAAKNWITKLNNDDGTLCANWD